MRGPRNIAVVAFTLATIILFSSCRDSTTGDNFFPVGHEDVKLLDRFGNAITATSTEPYSPRMTCGFCHDVDKMANGYHFQQGRTDLSGQIVVKADYEQDGRTFIQSSGMYGKW